MRLGGLLPFSLCDFPGRSAAVIFVQGCNFRCPFCHNGALLEAGAGRDGVADQVWALLERRRGFLHGVVISGGEPTLQRDLPGFMARIRGLGYAVKLDTNGSRPAMLRRLLDARLLDCVAMDIKAPLARYAALAGAAVDTDRIRESIDLIAGSGVAHQFRTTLVPPLLSGDERRQIRALVPKGSWHVWQRFRPDLALDPALRQYQAAATVRGERADPKGVAATFGVA